jgi:hypothetical protein
VSKDTVSDGGLYGRSVRNDLHNRRFSIVILSNVVLKEAVLDEKRGPPGIGGENDSASITDFAMIRVSALVETAPHSSLPSKMQARTSAVPGPENPRTDVPEYP